MNIENTTEHVTGIENQNRPLELGEKIAWWGIAIMIFYLIFIDK